MATDNWVVNNLAGEEWGLIKRLIFDSATRQINYADVVIVHSGHIARIPWDSFEMRDEAITLRVSEAVAADKVGVSEAIGSEGVWMDVWP